MRVGAPARPGRNFGAEPTVPSDFPRRKDDDPAQSGARESIDFTPTLHRLFQADSLSPFESIISTERISLLSRLSRKRNSLLLRKNSLLNSLGNLRQKPAEPKGFGREDIAQHPLKSENSLQIPC